MPVKQRQKYDCNHDIPPAITENQGQISPMRVTDLPGDRDKSHPGKRCPDHPESHQIPRRIPIRGKKHLTIDFPSCHEATQDQQ